MSPLVDEAERRRLVEDLDTTLFVEAGAGTGKTTAVVSRIVALVRAGRLEMERLVAITFTVAAAAELRVRVREGLERAAADATDRAAAERCAQAAAEVERARIETIHAFCSAILRMHPVEAGLPPDFEPLADLAAGIDTRDRFRRWFDQLRPGEPTGDAVRRLLLLGLKPSHLVTLFEALNENWDLLESVPAWDAPPPGSCVRAAGRFADDIEACRRLTSWCTAPDDDALHRKLQDAHHVVALLREVRDEDGALAALLSLKSAGTLLVAKVGRVANWRLTQGENVCTSIRATFEEMRTELEDLLLAVRTHLTVQVTLALRLVALEYAEERRRRGLVSYQDLLVRARNVVRDHPEVRDILHARWDCIVVDEFQDTDPLQAELAFRISARTGSQADRWPNLPLMSGRLCLVGDPKQSIYRFRRADISLYASVEDALRAGGAGQVSLQVNFRSGNRIIDAVNHAFGGAGGLMSGDGSTPHDMQARYVDLQPHAPEIPGSVHLLGGELLTRAGEMWRAEAAGTAGTVLRMLAEGWRVYQGTDEERACRPSDICILMPTRTNLRNLERALEEAHVRYRLESGSLIVATQEVRDLLSCLRSIDDPTDEVALVAALRSPAFGCSDVELLHWREAGGRWSYERPGTGTVDHVAAGLTALRELHGLRHQLSVPALVEEVISRRLLRTVALDDWRPRETMRRQRFVLDQVRALSRAGHSTLHDAVEHLERLSRDPVYDSAAFGGDDEDCVRVMTVHAAKGLEFPIVVVIGNGRKPASPNAPLFTDRDRAFQVRAAATFETPGFADLGVREKLMTKAERMRMLYVALTRARDHLVVSVYRAEKGAETDAAALEGRLLGHPAVDMLVLEPATPADTATADDAAPAGATPPDATPPDATILTDPDAHRLDEAAWLERRATLLRELGSVRTQTATGLAHEAEDPAGGEMSDVAAQRRGRGGTALGRAVHAVLQVVDLVTLDGIADHAAAQAAAEAIPERAADVERLARAACASDTVQRAVTGRHWREIPVGATIDGVVIEGFVDLLYEQPDGRLVVVDYKTDAVSSSGIQRRLERYRLQGGVYALLLQQATGREVAAIEFVFAAPGETRVVRDVAAAVDEVRAALRQSEPDLIPPV